MKKFYFGLYNGFDHKICSDWKGEAEKLANKGWKYNIFKTKDSALLFFVEYFREIAFKEKNKFTNLKIEMNKRKIVNEEERDKRKLAKLKKSLTREAIDKIQFQNFNYVIFTDGSCLKNPGGEGGYCGIILNSKEKKEELIVSGNEKVTTNNRMEIVACLEAIRKTPIKKNVLIKSDSQYVVNTFEKKWIYNWSKKNWKRTKRKEVANADLWRLLLEEVNKRNVRFQWVKGHNGDFFNEKCDKIAKREALKLIP